MTEEMKVMPRAEYELYASGASSIRLTWIKGSNKFVCLLFCFNGTEWP